MKMTKAEINKFAEDNATIDVENEVYVYLVHDRVYVDFSVKVENADKLISYLGLDYPEIDSESEDCEDDLYSFIDDISYALNSIDINLHDLSDCIELA